MGKWLDHGLLPTKKEKKQFPTRGESVEEAANLEPKSLERYKHDKL